MYQRSINAASALSAALLWSAAASAAPGNVINDVNMRTGPSTQYPVITTITAGAPIEVFDDLRAQYVKNRPQFYKDITLPFYGYNRPGAKISEGIREKWWLQGMLGGMKAGYDCIKAFSETDFTEDLKKFDVPTLILHGDDDQIVPIGAAALMSAKLVKNATLKVYPGFPHGMPTTNADQINNDLLAFVKQSKQAAA
jgi:non-heme chloroperoxidase